MPNGNICGVTGTSGGNAVITATANDGSGQKATMQITVVYHVANIALDASNSSLNINDTQTLTATITPTNAYNKNVTWFSSDNTIAMVTGNDSSALVTAMSAGVATITVTTEDGNHSATYVVTVTQPVTGIELDRDATTIPIGDTIVVNATVSPANASNVNVSWSANPTGIVALHAQWQFCQYQGGYKRHYNCNCHCK